MVDSLTIFSSDIWSKVVLPFLLVFTLIFAVLEKSKVLGEGKRQVNALVALSIGLIVVLFGYAIYIINYMVAFLAVALVIVFVFMILTGMIFEPGKFELHKNVKWALMGIIAVSVVVAVIYFTGAWDYLYDKVIGPGGNSALLANVIFIVAVIVAVAVVIYGGKESETKAK